MKGDANGGDWTDKDQDELDDLQRRQAQGTAADPPLKAKGTDRISELAARKALGKAWGRALPFIDISDWDTTPVPEREWAAHNRFPLRQVALLTGEGAIGKSIIELMLSVATVLGRDWLGAACMQGPAIYYGCEDERDELHRRLAPIVNHYGTSFEKLRQAGCTCCRSWKKTRCSPSPTATAS